jgi:putative ABC transport system permease protein
MALLFLLQWAASLFLIGALYRLSLDERRRELGIVKALGASDRFISSLLTIEQLLTSGAAALAGTVAGLLLIRVFARYLRDAAAIPFVLPDGATLALVAAGVYAAALLSGLLPALVSTRRWSRAEPFSLIKGDRRTPGAEL